ncbi:MAG: SsrA-binding protein SmpB [Candidatus Omnitrophica bacterium]|nr:SsrA-binding protein SmpB [Candidatus Omnitrophota bacterium]
MNQAIATNKEAFRDYEILQRFEAGIELKGSEVKSLRARKINLKDSFARVEAGQVYLYNAHISPYAQASYLNVEPTRTRRLLLHKREILKIAGFLSQKGLTLVPLKVYFNDRGFAKVELALAKGKKKWDKREDIKRREMEQKIRKVLKNTSRK